MVRKLLCLTGILLSLALPRPAAAQVTFYVGGDGEKSFIIEGDDIGARSEVELAIVYDTQNLANPKVSVEQGVVTDVSDSSGTLIVKAEQGEDSTATFTVHLTFENKGVLPAQLFSVTGRIVEPDGTPVATKTLPASNPPLLQSFSRDEDATGGETGMSTYLADILRSERNVLQRFRNFKGKKGLTSYVALFDRMPGEGFVQDPPVALSDGQMSIRVLCTLDGAEMSAPDDIAVSDAKLVRLEKGDRKGWVVTVLPNPGAWDSSLIVKVNDKIFEFPLVVAPRVKVRKDLSDLEFLAELDRFNPELANLNKGEPIQYRHALLDYVFTANYLAGRQDTEGKAPTGE
ncbi:hypothetical protein [Geomesophilobacter sediminis]|uniref:Uncharacterized protein n=1 Tax=Geomesophilobacter sediminis TaxID=2798584 RepID=A0A8J7LY33_9BACT|nr:hypothetical protein [Geomesophilobacter sediminis]MBJ6724231.1 hypothetical protein [Geomesophilobacter sediminis]